MLKLLRSYTNCTKSRLS